MTSIPSILKTQSLHPHIPVAFIGPPGSGKSCIIEEWCEKNKKPCVKLLASTMDTTDIAGIIISTSTKRIVNVDGDLTVISGDGGSAKTLTPEWASILKNGGVLFLDEINTAFREVQDTLLTLIQSRHFPNGEKLHPLVQIVAAMNDSVQCNNYTLSPAMRNRFAWYEFNPSVKQWFNWARKQLDDEFNAFLFSAIQGGLTFSTNEEFMDDTQMLFCTPRSLWNCIEWSEKQVKSFLSNMGHFLPPNTTTLFKAIDRNAIKDRSNAIFVHLRDEIEGMRHFDDILSTADSVPSEGKDSFVSGLTPVTADSYVNNLDFQVL